MAPTKKIVILGGSYGGVSTAHYFLQHSISVLPDSSVYQVVIVSPAAQAFCRPACPRALISDDLFDQSKLFVSIPDSFKHYTMGGFEFVHGKVTSLAHDNRTVTITLASGDTQTIQYHALVIATGASTPSPLLGLNGDSDSLRSSWKVFREALTRSQHIVVAGGGPAGVETAGELGHYLNGRPGWFRGKRDPKVRITLVTSGPEILPYLSTAVARQAEAYLLDVGVTLRKNTRVTAVSPTGAGTDDGVASKVTVTLSGNHVLEDVDLYIPATGTRPNTEFVEKSLLAADGRVETNTRTLRVDGAGQRVYAIGDAASFARPAVHNILAAIPTLGANMRRDLLRAAGVSEAKVEAERTFEEDTRQSQLVPVGRSVGVGVVQGMRLPSFLVWLMKGRDYWLWTTEKLWNGKQWAKAK
ncbi:hypothetical protein BKA56DRAFT_592713 [Ilyonectria sp. MPI-CAGE-AT-0026]|nr:hypothetical protein BKA56DRAFT_592713 [Ilyonectria sp. MPI-CAGE-AT-0026]